MIDEVIDEGVQDKEPLYGDEEADTQKAIEESLKEVHGAYWGPLPPVVFREPDSGKFQPLPEVQGNGKEKVGVEQAAQVLLNLQTPKKKSHADQYIFQRRTSTQTKPSGHDESSSLYAKFGLTNSETESDEEVLPVIQSGAQDEGQAGLNPGIQDEGQAGSNPGDAAVSQHQSSHVVHTGPNLEHMDFEVTDTSIQQNPEQIDEEFTTTAYPNVQENLKLPTEDQVRLEEPASSAGTLSSLQHLDKELSFADQFLVEKSQEDEPEKTNSESERIGELEQHMADMVKANQALEERLDKQGNRLYNLENLDIPHKVRKAVDEIVTDAVDWAIQAPLRDRFIDLPEADIKEILHHRMSPSHQPPHPPPPPGSSGTPGAFGASGYTAAPSSSKTTASAEHTAWTTTDSRLKLSVSSIPKDLHMDADSAPDEQKPLSEEDKPATPEPAWSIPSSDLPVPTNNWASALASTYAPPPENLLLAQTDDMATFMDWYCKRQGLTELTQKDLEGPAFEIVHPNVIHLQHQMEECHKLLTDQVDDAILRYNVSKPLPLGGPRGQVIIQSDFFFNKDLEYLRHGSKGIRPALSISKMKAAYYLDVGLEQMVPDQMWIEEECKYNIAAMYGISHWWFQRQQFYIDRHTSKGDRRAVRTHRRILSVVRIEVFSLYGYDYMKKIVLRRADLKEYTITERDFKYLYPSNFEDLYLLNLQGHLNHLPPEDKKILTTAVNL
ncbi:hypothetical protein Tco_1437083 [Tanacetum coccineum]